MSTIVATAGGGNWSATGTWTGAVVPTAADDVQLGAGSGNVTVDVTSVCRSLDCTGYTSTLTHAAAVTLSLGDATAGASNIALKLVAGMTYTLGSPTTSALSFISTSATQQTITTGGKTLGSWTVNGVGCSYLLTDTNTTTTTATVTLTTGILNTNSQTCNWGLFVSNSSNTRTITMGSSTIAFFANSGWNTSVVTGLTVTANTATVNTPNSFNSATFNFNGLSVASSSVPFIAGGNITIANFTHTGTASKTLSCAISTTATLTCTGTLTITGNSAVNRIFFASGATGTARTVSAATVSLTNVDVQDITAAGAAVPFTGTSLGDDGGNTNFTFTTPVTQTHTASTGGNWSDITKWTTRVPLPQDDVIIDSNTTGTIVTDMPRLGKSINFTGFTGTASFSSVANALFGSLTLSSGMTVSGTLGLAPSGRGAYSITSAGKTFTQAITITAPNGAYTLADSLNIGNSLTCTAGTLDTANMNVTATLIKAAFANSAGGTINCGSSAISLTATTAGTYLIERNTGATLNGQTATFTITTATSNSRKIAIASAGLATSTVNYTIAGSTGPLVFELAGNIIGTLNFSDANNARTLTLPASTTTTFTNFNVMGTAGKLMTVNSSTGGVAATISKTSGYVNCDYLSIQDSTATGGASWYAGVNSTNVSNNTGWFFQAYSPSKFLELM